MSREGFRPDSFGPYKPLSPLFSLSTFVRVTAVEEEPPTKSLSTEIAIILYPNPAGTCYIGVL